MTAKRKQTLTEACEEAESTDPAVRKAAQSFEDMKYKVLGSFPYHFRDDESRGPCPWSNTVRMTPEEPCPNGCSGAQHHYANDGHKECTTE